MRWSQMFAPTLRDDPAEADAPSDRLLLRAGYVRRLAPGHYTLLPLAVRVRAKIIGIVRAELDAIGAQEMLLPAPHPAEPSRRSEIFATVARELNSYRQLPQRWFQFQTTFRNEPRPKGGLMRTREFTLKDAYSFDIDRPGLDASFDAFHGAYARIFERLGIPVLPCEAAGGTLGGAGSTEFMSPSDVGEDLVVRCAGCGYAADIECATSVSAPAADVPGLPSPERFDTPGVRTIEDLVAFDAPADRQIKTLVYILDGTLTLVLLRGDHPLNERKLADATGAAALRPADPAEIQDALGALPGSLGAVGVSLP
ncbi:MAG: proline--tRNA ligase, partial [Spirillospora sp.]